MTTMAKAKKPIKGKSGRKGRARSIRPSGLTGQQEAFCQHFALNQNAAAAYEHAYPASRKHDAEYRSHKGRKMLALDPIKARIAALSTKVVEVVEKKFEITAEKVIQELAAIAFQNSADYFEWGTFERQVRRKNKETGRMEALVDENDQPITESVSYARIKPSEELDHIQKKAVLSVSESTNKFGDKVIEAKMADKLGALKLLGQHLALFKERVEHTGRDGKPIETTTTHKLPDLKDVKDPRDALKVFESFRLGLLNPAPTAAGKPN